jgi:hypothetical protein
MVDLITGRDDEFRAVITILYREELGRDPEPEGMQTWLTLARQGWTGEQIRAAIHNSPEAVAYRNRPPAPPPASRLHLEVRGRDFVDEHGARRVLVGTDQFRGFRDFLDGVDLTPLFAESRALGFDLWRVFLMGSVRQNGLLQLGPEGNYYDALRPFAEAVNAQGIVLLATVFVDAQDIMPDVNQRRVHWTAVAERLRGTATLLSGGNEWQKNGFNPGELSDPGMFWSRGSDIGDAAPYRPYGSFAEFHPRRDLPTAKMDTVASPVFIYGQNGLTAPLIIDEPPRMGLDGSGAEYEDAFLCWQFARHYATECAAAVFHSRAGQRGHVMDPLTRACAENWVRGMQIQ